MRATRAVSAAVALAGLGIAAYLTAVHYAGGTPVCAIAHGCAEVQQSDYAQLAGVPVALLGAAGYVAILTCLAIDGERARTAAAFLSLAGAGFSAWLTYVEVVELAGDLHLVRRLGDLHGAARRALGVAADRVGGAIVHPLTSGPTRPARA